MASTKTIKASGGDYTSLAAWEDAMDGDLTGTGVAEAICYALDDTAALTITGWTTTASDYIYIHADSTGRHAGVWDGDKYNLVVTDANAIAISEDYVRVDGLQLSTISPTATRNVIVVGLATASANDVRISNSILVGHRNDSYGVLGLSFSDADTIAYVWNSIVYGISGSAISRAVLFSGATLGIYSCTLIGGVYAIRTSSGTTTAKNAYGGAASTACFSTSATLNKTTCASSDATGSIGLQSIAHSTANFVNVTAGTEDYHLASGSALIGVGTDTSGDGAPLNFTDDIDGDTRS